MVCVCACVCLCVNVSLIEDLTVDWNIRDSFLVVVVLVVLLVFVDVALRLFNHLGGER